MIPYWRDEQRGGLIPADDPGLQPVQLALEE